MPLTRRFPLAIFTVGAIVASATAVGAQTDLEDLPPGVTVLADVAAGTHEVTGVPAGLELRVRALPGTDQDILSTLPNDTIVRTTGERAQIGSTVWLQVQIGGRTGWSSSTYLTPTTAVTPTTGPPTTVSSVTTLEAVAAGTHEVTAVPAGLELRVRSEPGTENDILFTLPNGTIVPTTGERAQIGSTVWLQVRLDGTIGWSSSAYLTALTAEVEAPVSPTVPGVTALEAVDPGTHEVTDVPADLELRVRVNPGIGQAIVTTLANGTIVRTTGERAQVGSTIWLQVDLDGTIGWSSSTYLTPTAVGGGGQTPVAPAPSGPGVVVLDTVGAGAYRVTDVPAGLQLRVRSNPGVGNPQIGLLSNDTVVPTTGRRAQVGSTIWLEVEFGNTTGWSSSTYLTEEAEVVTGFAELMPEGQIDAVITAVAVDEEGDDISVLIGDDLMAVSDDARILDADGRALDHMSWAETRSDVSSANPLIAEVVVRDGEVVELRQTAMI